MENLREAIDYYAGSSVSVAGWSLNAKVVFIEGIKVKLGEKVFSKKKFIEICKKLKTPSKAIESNLELWANTCEGKTKEEIEKLGLKVDDAWMVEK